MACLSFQLIAEPETAIVRALETCIRGGNTGIERFDFPRIGGRPQLGGAGIHFGGSEKVHELAAAAGGVARSDALLFIVANPDAALGLATHPKSIGCVF